MFGLWRYSEEWDADSWYPFKSGWFEGQFLFFLLSAMMGFGGSFLITQTLPTQPFLAGFIALVIFYAYFKIRKLETRMQQISETT